jgi:hypothetical protein
MPSIAARRAAHQLGFLICLKAEMLLQDRWTSCPQRSMSAIPVNKTLLRVAAAALVAFSAATEVSASDPARRQPGDAAATAAQASSPPPFADRAERLLRQLSLGEKISLMSTDSPTINRSGSVLIPAFNWWQECLHGFNEQRERGATIFPQVGTACFTVCTG